MFCMKCGKPTEDGQTICPECAAASAPVQEQPAQVPVEVPEEIPVEAPAAEPVFAEPAEEPAAVPFEETTTDFTSQTSENLFDLNFSAEEEKKEKAINPKQKKLVTMIVSGVLALAVVTVGLLGFLVWDWGDWFQNLFWKLKPAEEYKNNVEEKALTDEDSSSEIAVLRNGIVGVYGALVNSVNQEEGSADVTLDVEIGDELISMLEMAVGSQLPEGMEIPNKASLTLSSSGNQDLSQMDMGISLNDVQLMQLRYIMDILNAEGYLGILAPEDMADGYLSMPLPEELTNSAYTEIVLDFVAELPSEEEFAQMVDKYIMLAFQQIQEVEKESNTIEAAGVKQNVTVLTYEISQETIVDIALAILEEAEDDETLYQLLQAFCQLMNEVSALQATPSDGYYGYYEPEYYDADDIFEQIPDLIAELEDMDADDEAIIVIETYVDSKGNIVGRQLEVEDADTTIAYYTAVKGNKIGMLMEMESYGETVTLEGSGTVKKQSIVTGELALDVFGDEYAIIELDGFDIKKYTGTIRFKLGEDAVDMLEDELDGIPVGSLLDIADIALEMTLNTNSVSVGIVNGKNSLVKISLSGAMKESGEASAPNKSVSIEDTEALEEWLSKVDMDLLADQLEKAGLPDEIVDIVREADPMDLISSFGAQPEYNPGYNSTESGYSF